MALGSGLTLVMTSAWQLWLLWGFAVGVGTGSLALVFGAIVANRWFVRHRGVVVGVFSAASSTGQLVFLPAIAQLADGPGWRWAAGLVSVVRPAARPARLAGDARPARATSAPRPYGADPEADTVRAAPSTESPARLAIRTLRESSRSRTFWILFVSFWICGWSTNGLIGTHFIPAAHDHGMPATTSASLLALIGVFDIVGTVASGWLTDRVDTRYLLFTYYFFRGLSLLVVPWLLADTVHPSLFVFIVFYGLDWVATVPPTVALCRQHFGIERSGVVFGWVFAAHMVGAGVAASFAGWVRQVNGDYFSAWMTAGGLCLVRRGAVPAHPTAPGRARSDHDVRPDVTVEVFGRPVDAARPAPSSCRSCRGRPPRRRTGRSDGSWRNSTPWAPSSSYVCRQSSTFKPRPCMPPSSSARLIAATMCSASGAARYGEVHLELGLAGVHDRAPAVAVAEGDVGLLPKPSTST